MNVMYSTTEDKTSERLTDQHLAVQWEIINWNKAEKEVNKLQVRIAKATINKKYNEIKRLQYLLTHSFYAKALAVRKVTTNKGKNTPGIDNELWTTSALKMKAIHSLTDKGYKAKPLRRVYIEKKGNKSKKRPLGIPTMYDRAMQALYTLALDPVSESTADKRSFGFRKRRCAQDACEHIFSTLSHKGSAKWILEGDIKGCFDNINHEWLIQNIPMDKSILKQFLKAGFIFKGDLFPTEVGSPQGGVISAIYANMTLDGMEKVIEDNYHRCLKGNISKYAKSRQKVYFIRYADDFVVTALTPEIAQEAKQLLNEFLSTRGLEMSEEKTLITNIDDGFDFLGWTFRKFKGKLIIKPAKKSVQALSHDMHETILKKGKAWSQDFLILKLNQKLNGWVNYHQNVCAKTTFSHIDYILFSQLWRWAKRRHPKKGKHWVANRYWHQKDTRKWVFSCDNHKLLKASSTPIIRHIKVRKDANPYIETEYFEKRRVTLGSNKLSGNFKRVWIKQKGNCIYCKMPLEINGDRELLFRKPIENGGTWAVSNLAYSHKLCDNEFNRSRPKGL